MANRDDRDKIAPGIYRDATQWYATVRVRGAGELDPKTRRRKPAFREKRFPLSVSIIEIQAERERIRARLLNQADRGTAAGSFARDAASYLKNFTTHLVSAKDRKNEINEWVKALGKDRPRGTIKPADVARIRGEWLAAGKSPKTVNNRTDSLRHLYRSLDGKRAWTPCDDLQRLHVHRRPIRHVSDAIILGVDQKLQEHEQLTGRHKDRIQTKKPRARFRVLVSTGRRHSEIMRAERGDIDLERRIWLPRDGKGGFSPGIYLNDDMLAAWTFFIEAEAWGNFETGRFSIQLRKAGWPDDVPVYNARHTFGITLSESGVDLADVGAMMGHRQASTTRKHYVPVLNSRLQKVSESLSGRFAGWPALQTTQQTGSRKTKKNPIKTGERKVHTSRQSQGRK